MLLESTLQKSIFDDKFYSLMSANVHYRSNLMFCVVIVKVCFGSVTCYVKFDTLKNQYCLIRVFDVFELTPFVFCIFCTIARYEGNQHESYSEEGNIYPVF